jgi:small-conductance mechanosensitive channel
MQEIWTNLVSHHHWVSYVAEILGLVLAAWAFHTFVLGWLRRLAKRTKTTLDDALLDILDSALRPILILTVLDISLNLFELPAKLMAVMNRVLYLGILVIALYYCSKTLQLLVGHWLAKRAASESLRDSVRYMSRVVFAGLGIIIVLDNLGVSLTAVWTTLGVGSVAIALALQDTLSNFFAGFYLRLDNPIHEGDYVKLDSGHEGYVAEMGWRSTRMRTLPNNIIVVPNSKLATAVVTNYSLPQPQMSLLISISVGYGSDPDLVERVLVEEARAAAGKVDGLLAEPAPFVRFIPGFGESSLDFTLICRVNTYVDQYLVQHELRKRILRRFRREGIEIPFPQRDVHLSGQTA